MKYSDFNFIFAQDHTAAEPGAGLIEYFFRPGRVHFRPQGIGETKLQRSAEDERVFEGYRRWGYLAANLDPLGFLTPIVHPELIAVGKAAAAARQFYCGTIGAEFVHIDDTERRRWIAERLECDAPRAD